ncbi:hypothetical protein H0H93_000301, partial [Arthromyces matolae]
NLVESTAHFEWIVYFSPHSAGQNQPPAPNFLHRSEHTVTTMNILELIRGVISVSLLGLSFLLVSATPIPSDAVVPQSESGPTLIPDVINISDAAM